MGWPLCKAPKPRFHLLIKAHAQRRAGQAEGPNGEGAEGDRHLAAEAVEVGNFELMRFDVDSPSAEKKA